MSLSWICNKHSLVPCLSDSVFSTQRDAGYQTSNKHRLQTLLWHQLDNNRLLTSHVSSEVRRLFFSNYSRTSKPFIFCTIDKSPNPVCWFIIMFLLRCLHIRSFADKNRFSKLFDTFNILIKENRNIHKQYTCLEFTPPLHVLHNQSICTEI